MFQLHEEDSLVDQLIDCTQALHLADAPMLPVTPSGSFDFRPPPDCPRWPGPHYDDLTRLLPGIFDHRRPSTTSPKQRPGSKATHRVKSFLDQRQSHSRRQNQSDVKSQIRRYELAMIDKKKPTTSSPCGQYGRPAPRDQPLHLLTLPGEIRNQIFRYLYTVGKPMSARYRQIAFPKKARPIGVSVTDEKKSVRRFPREPGAALVCRQLHHEVLSHFYSENTFVFQRHLSHDIKTGGCTWALLPIQPETITQWAGRGGAPLTSVEPRATLPAAVQYIPTDALTHVELEYMAYGDADRRLGRAPCRHPIRYTFRRVNGQNTIEHNLKHIHLCLCFESKMYDLAVTALVDERPPELGTTLAELVRDFVSHRQAKLGLDARLLLNDNREAFVATGKPCCRRTRVEKVDV